MLSSLIRVTSFNGLLGIQMASLSFEDIPEILERNEPKEVLPVPIIVTMNDDDQDFCEEICLRLQSHLDPQVRGNSILGFGHIARRFGTFNDQRILELVNQALLDESDIVRRQASTAAMDISSFIGIELSNDG